jgi:2'-5' RNA ligase
VPADWHVTLHFIGPVEIDRVADISVGADVPLRPFEWTLDQPIVWAHGLAVLGTTEVPKTLQALHERLGNTLRRLDLAVESRRFQPHVTLARRAEAAIPPTASVPVVWSVRSYALAVSTGDKDHRYRVIREYR